MGAFAQIAAEAQKKRARADNRFANDAALVMSALKMEPGNAVLRAAMRAIVHSARKAGVMEPMFFEHAASVLVASGDIDFVRENLSFTTVGRELQPPPNMQ